MGCQFDQFIDRRNTQSQKWDGVLEMFGEENLIPMWIADMDFRPPQEVVEAVTKRAAHGIYGYVCRPKDYVDVIRKWLRERHGWEIEPEWLTHSPGVVPGLALAIWSLTEPGDKIVIQPPVYPPFARVITINDREKVENPLIFKDGRFTMDFEDLEKHFQAGAKVLMLCSPHNPVGRVWDEGELKQLQDLVVKYDVTVLSDEIWADLVFPGFRHRPVASISEEMSQRTLTFMAPSKTFNIAGLYISNIIIPNAELREKFCGQLQRLNLTHINLFGMVASDAAYRCGADWLDQLLDYLKDNVEYVCQELPRITDKIKVVRSEGTYVLWLDCRGLGLPAEELNQFFIDEAGIVFNDGLAFGESGRGYQRMNIGCPRSIIKEALTRLAKALK